VVRRLLVLGTAVAIVVAVATILAPNGDTARLRSNAACHVTQTHSISGTVPTTIKFVNKTGGTVQIYWANYTGVLVHYFTVLPGKAVTARTFNTHVWLALNSQFSCVGYVVAPRAVFTIS
jgi:VHL beta domain